MPILPDQNPSPGTLTPGQIANWAQQAGFSGPDLTTAIAVALAESGGNTDAVNHNSNGSTDYGVWQINSVHADLFNKYPQWWSVENADMAYEIYKAAGNKFTPWTTYTSGAYQKFMTQAAQAAGNPSPAAGGGPDQTTTVNPISQLADGVGGLISWLSTPSNWIRILEVIGGATLVLIGLHSIIADTSVYQAGKQVVEKAATVAAVA